MRALARLRPMLLAAPLLLGPAGAAWAQDLIGTVVGPQSDPKPSARVQLVGSNEASQRYVAVTDHAGRFRIADFHAGEYLVRIRQGNEMHELVETLSGGEVSLVVPW